MFDTGLTLNDLLFLAKGAGITLAITAISVLFGTLLGVVFGTFKAQATTLAAAPLTFVLDILRSVPLLISADPGQRLPVDRRLRLVALRRGLRDAVALHFGLLHRNRARRHRGGSDGDPSRRAVAGHELGPGHGQRDIADGAARGAAGLDRTDAGGDEGHCSCPVAGDHRTAAVFARFFVTRLQEPLFILLITGAIYFLISFPIARLGGRLEQRWREND